MQRYTLQPAAYGLSILIFAATIITNSLGAAAVTIALGANHSPPVESINTHNTQVRPSLAAVHQQDLQITDNNLADGVGHQVSTANLVILSSQLLSSATDSAPLGTTAQSPILTTQLQPPPTIQNNLSELVGQQPAVPSALPAIEPAPERPRPLSPLERPLFRLFGFETATPIKPGEVHIELGGNTFNNPKDFRQFFNNTANRSNDAHIDLTYGLADNLQISAGLSGKDDTIFVNLVRNNSQLQILNNVIPLQAKWRFYNQNRLEAGVVLGAELPNSTSALFFQPNRVINYTDSVANPGFANGNRFSARDNSVYFSVAAPIAYQANDKLRLHLNPQISFLPSRIPITTTAGNVNTLTNAQIGFDGQGLNYYGTIVGIGMGASYQLSPSVQIAADFTPIVAGQNSADSGGNNSLFVAHPVWNIGLQYAPNSHSALALFATNRFSATPASPSNLLVQPGNDWSVGFNVSYVPDFAGTYSQNQRSTYPDTRSLLMQASGFPSATLPAASVAYSLGIGKSINPTIRYGLLDDLEVALSYNNASRTEMPIETDLIARWGLWPDRGQSGFSGALDLGLLRLDGTGTPVSYSLYADTPLSYRLPGGNVKLNATPKLLIPAQFQNVSNILGISLGASWQIAPNTEILGQVTPIISGQNQLVAGQNLQSDGRTPVYTVGVRQLFPAGNSTYGVELYYSNGAGANGFQGLMALPNSDKEFGIRFSLLNGTPLR